MIPNQVFGRPFPAAGLGELPGHPFGRRVSRHAEPKDLAPAMPKNQQTIEQLERKGRNDECDNPIGMVTQERLPPLRWGSPVSRHIFGNRGLTHIYAELEEFAMDPRSAPERVGEAHVADQLTDFERHFWSPTARARLPSPEQPKSGPMPSDDGLRLD